MNWIRIKFASDRRDGDWDNRIPVNRGVIIRASAIRETLTLVIATHNTIASAFRKPVEKDRCRCDAII